MKGVEWTLSGHNLANLLRSLAASRQRRMFPHKSFVRRDSEEAGLGLGESWTSLKGFAWGMVSDPITELRKSLCKIRLGIKSKQEEERTFFATTQGVKDFFSALYSRQHVTGLSIQLDFEFN